MILQADVVSLPSVPCQHRGLQQYHRCWWCETLTCSCTQSSGWGLHAQLLLLNLNCKVELKMCFSGVAFPQLWSCLPQGCCWDWMQEDSWGSGWRDGEEAVLLVVTSGEGGARLHFANEGNGSPSQCRNTPCSIVHYSLWFKRTWSKILRQVPSL